MQSPTLTARISGVFVFLGSLALAPGMAAPRYTPGKAVSGEGERNSPGVVRLVRQGK